MTVPKRLHDLAMLLTEQGHIYRRAYNRSAAGVMFRAALVAEADAAAQVGDEQIRRVLLDSARELEALVEQMRSYIEMVATDSATYTPTALDVGGGPESDMED